jgi:hypothetical protein
MSGIRKRRINMEDNKFSDFIGQAFNRAKKVSPGALAGEVGSWWWNRLPDQADRFTRPGIRNKINSAVGTGLVEAANFGTDAVMDMALAAGAAATAPQSGGTSLLAYPVVKWGANIAKDAAMSQFVEPGLYGMADELINLGGRMPSPPGYKGSALQRNVNTADKSVTDLAQFISKTHPKNQALEQARKGVRVIKKLTK